MLRARREGSASGPCVLPSALPSIQLVKPLDNHVVYFLKLLAVLAVCCLLNTALNGVLKPWARILEHGRLRGEEDGGCQGSGGSGHC